MVISIAELVDLRRYPIAESGPERDSLAADLRRTLETDGCAVLKGFIRAERVAALVAECERVAPHGHRNFSRTNAYFTQDHPELPASHPLRRFYDRSNAFVAADHFGADSMLRVIYQWPAFGPFIHEALGEHAFHRYADPLADVIVNLAEQGNGFPWHFDTNNYTVTLAIQNTERGGDFEYCPGLRSTADENYAGVQAVLDGDRSGVRVLQLEPGDRQIFKGRYAMHRVTPLNGALPRFVAFCRVLSRSSVRSSNRAWSAARSARASCTAGFCRCIWNARGNAPTRWSTEAAAEGCVALRRSALG